jgi:hypothetical protein
MSTPNCWSLARNSTDWSARGVSAAASTAGSTASTTGATTTALTVSGYVPESRQVIAGSGLTGGGPLNADVTLSSDFSSTAPLSVNASGSAGSATTVSRSDHQHPAVNISSSSQVTGTLGLANGGTNASLTPAAGGIVYSGSSALAVGSVGTNNYHHHTRNDDVIEDRYYKL